MERYLCIHGHFYQPPRENPWLEAVELQDSAYPFHDWNARITRECYAPNGASRVLDGEGRIIRIVNNYARMSFNFGPTLLGWMEEKAPEAYESILAADRESQKHFSGHGSALAQVYNHMILPLARRQDKYTQILWGIRDFEHRFSRPPEGMWLPETAVDLESLDILVHLGIRFTVLSPYQAHQVRRIRGRNWVDVTGGRIDPSCAYSLRLPSGLRINLFFYDGPISQAVAFEKLLNNGEQFALRLLSAFSDTRAWPQLVHIATDGETYGHHHQYGDMALSYVLQHIESNNLAHLTNYGEFLEKHPPNHEVKILENSSWSCIHGVERWRSDCGCSSGLNPGWNQAWRGPLREAFDWLRGKLDRYYEEKGGLLFKDPWAARGDYIQVILDRSPQNIDRVLKQHACRDLNETDKIASLKLLELQRHAMLMYTSCGWFFDELSGIETVQVIQYAARAIQLYEDLFGNTLESQFLERLERAKSNVPEYRDGRMIYEKFVKPAMVDLKKVSAHYAIRSAFEPYPEHARIYCYDVDREDYQSPEAGKMRMALGRARFTSKVTRESAVLTFGVFHFGEHNLSGGVGELRGKESYPAMIREVGEAFSRADVPGVIRILERFFGGDICFLKSLFRDEQRKIVKQILDRTLGEAEAVYRKLYEHLIPLMRFLSDLKFPFPKSFQTAAEFALNSGLRRALEAEEINWHQISSLLEEAKWMGVLLSEVGLGHSFKGWIERIAVQFQGNPQDTFFLSELDRAVELACLLPFEVDFWKVQNIYHKILRVTYPEFRRKAEKGEGDAQTWVGQFTALGEKLHCRTI